MMRWKSVREEDAEWISRRPLKGYVLRMTLRAAASAFAASVILLQLLVIAGWLAAGEGEILRYGLLTALIGGAIGGDVSWRAARSIARLVRSNARFEKLSRTDALSGLLNRRAFGEALLQAAPGSTLVIIDVDCFKTINDSYGHSVGDEVIRRVASLISACSGLPQAGRLGGEEFGMILSSGSVDERAAAVDALRARIAAESFRAGDTCFRVTISAGLAETEHGRPLEHTYSAADKALYLAKAGGRNRVVHDREGLTLILDMVAGRREDEAERQAG